MVSDIPDGDRKITNLFLQCRETRVTVIAILRDLAHDAVGGVRMMKMYASCPGSPSGGLIRALQLNTNICYSPQPAAPHL